MLYYNTVFIWYEQCTYCGFLHKRKFIYCFANRDINYNPLVVVQNGCVFCRRRRDEMVYSVFFHSFVFASWSKYMPCWKRVSLSTLWDTLIGYSCDRGILLICNCNEVKLTVTPTLSDTVTDCEWLTDSIMNDSNSLSVTAELNSVSDIHVLLTSTNA